MQLNPSIFKAYDIRGVVPLSLTGEVARALGRSFGTLALLQGEAVVAVGRDGRLSGPELVEALIRGLTEAGVQVIDIGMVTTPMLYFAAHTLCSSGIQVTGSHNPKDDNGFKMVLKQQPVYGEQIQALYRMMDAGSWTLHKGGMVRQADVMEAYLARITSGIRLSRPMKVVVDCGNGVAGASAPAVLRALGCEVTELFSDVDGNFPHHHPDPSKPENLRALIGAVQAGDAEVGLAFDGDGDRLGVITREGNIIYPDRQLMLFARDVLTRAKGGTVIFDVKCSQQLAPVIRRAGGVPLMYKTGHSLIKARMHDIDAPLGGEMSGHIFFRERWYGFDDATYAAARLLEILSRGGTAGDVLNALPDSFSTPELNVPCDGAQAHAIVQRLVALARLRLHSGELTVIDGLRVDWPDGFGLIRASNTTPVLVLRFEGANASALARIRTEMMQLLHEVLPGAQVQEATH